MSYAVVHMQKFKASDVKGIQIHNQRESLNSKNPDIDREKTHLNYDLNNPDPINYNHRVKEILKEGYTGTKAIRKDATVMVSTLVTSDKEFFSKLNFVEQRKFFQDAYDYLKERYGEKNIVSATVHLDEHTPHMHLVSVPLTEDGRLSAKSLFDRKALRELQEQLPKHLQSNGFDIQRGESGSEKSHVDTAEYKKQLAKEVRTLEQTQKALQSDLKAFQNELSQFDEVKPQFDKINQIEGKPGILNKGKVTINEEDFEVLRTMAKKCSVLENQVKDLKKKNESMSKDLNKLYSGYQGNQFKTIEIQRKFSAVSSKLGMMSNFIEATKQVDAFEKYRREQIQEQAVKARLRGREMDDD